ncbi:MAG TPA: glycosyltransferase family 25 protein [Chthoniobacterales bacterium]|jgi:glycosyl transferase family 25
MRAYIINLDSATDRWESVQKSFSTTSFTICRVSGVNGHALQLPIAAYSEGLYRWFHGRPTSLGHVGCYLSHVKAMKAFLESDDEHALIAEDDLTLNQDFEEVLTSAREHSNRWNVLRLSGLSEGKPAVIAQLSGEYQLCVSFGRVKGTGAYLIDRKAARALSKGLLPMRLPIDHAMDREWFFGLRAATIRPFPSSQTETGFRSSIQIGKSLKLSSFRRYIATYPYQAFNEIHRWIFRGWQYLRA